MNLNDFLAKKKLAAKKAENIPLVKAAPKQLFLEKYRPKAISELIGQEKPVTEVMDFLKNWKKGSALLISGPPGTGKTLLVELLAEEFGFQLLVMDASDKRTAKEIESALSGAVRQRTLFRKGRIILMDEIDAVSGIADRGAVQSIIKIIEESEYPVILIANDAYNPKLSGLKRHCRHIKFNRLRSASIAKKLSDIAEKEGLKIDKGTIEALAAFSKGDMRSAIIDLQILSTIDNPSPENVNEIVLRERLEDIFSALSTIFFSGSLSTSRKAIRNMDADEIFQWIETNIPKVLKTSQDIASAYELLSVADMFRVRVTKQQNWRFKTLMSDLMCGVSVRTEPYRGFIPYQFPDKIAAIGRTRFARAMRESAYRKIAAKMHISARAAGESLPYLKMILGKNIGEAFGLSEEEIGIL